MTIEKRSVCWSCGDEYSDDALASFGDRMICGSCKPNYVQSVKENVQPQSVTQKGPDWLSQYELGLGDLFSRTFEAYGKIFKTSLMMALVVLGPVYVISALISVAGIRAGIPNTAVIARLFGLIGGLLGIAIMIGVVHAVHRHTDGVTTDWKTALSFGFSRFRSSFGTLVFAGLIIFGLFLLFIVPGIIWAIYYSFVLPIAGVTQMTGKEALDYSKSLVKGQWWRVFGYMFIIQALILMLSFVFGIGAGVAAIYSPQLGAILGAVSEFVATLVSYLTITFSTIFFLNLHYRKENVEEV